MRISADLSGSSYTAVKRLSDNLPYLYSSFYDIFPAKWGTNINTHVHKIDEFVRISADLSGAGYTVEKEDWVIISHTYTAVSTILFSCEVGR